MNFKLFYKNMLYSLIKYYKIKKIYKYNYKKNNNNNNHKNYQNKYNFYKKKIIDHYNNQKNLVIN